ncbi:hypothetical protein HCN44_007788 [Aphidius gifuensis]|uniref:Uncharacterized protein n=1 Tax=Aphidius gifuensis TaxID=684658 RepID=A0A834XJT8_APHGI|nr:hypothetical protein HCN44_007788 [Aphidius gifuensis]
MDQSGSDIRYMLRETLKPQLNGNKNSIKNAKKKKKEKLAETVVLNVDDVDIFHDDSEDKIKKNVEEPRQEINTIDVFKKEKKKNEKLSVFQYSVTIEQPIKCIPQPKDDRCKKTNDGNVSEGIVATEHPIEINEYLNDYCLANIFSHLPILQAVRVNQVLPYQNNEQKIEVVLEVLSLCGQHLKHLTYKNLSLDDKKVPKKIIEKCCNLTIFECHLVIDDDGDIFFNNLCKSMSRLKVLKIYEKYDQRQVHKKCMISSNSYTSSVAMSVLTSVPMTIEKICIINLNNYPIELNQLPLENFNSLQCLTLNNYEIKSNITKKIANTKTIMYLDLQECSVENPELINDLYNLEYLNICKMYYLNQEMLANIGYKLKKLKHLELEAVSSTEDDPELPVSFAEVGECENLMNLNIHYADSIIIDSIMSGCKKLKYLFIQQYFHNSRTLIQSQDLESLAIRWADNIDVDLIRNIARDCPKLKYLCLSTCPTRDILQEIPNKFANLSKLDLRDNKHVDDNLLTQISSSLKALKMLSCQNCLKVTNDGVETILKKCLILERFNVDGCPHIGSDIRPIVIGEAKQRTNNIILYFQLNDEYVFNENESRSRYPWLRFISPKKACGKNTWSPFN